MLWKWSKRRHHNKGNYWIRRKYFKTIDTRRWVFCEDGLELFEAPYVAIKRYIKIRGEANPFDPEFETYFEKRLGTKMANDITLTQRLRNLWKSQKGKCLIC